MRWPTSTANRNTMRRAIIQSGSAASCPRPGLPCAVGCVSRTAGKERFEMVLADQTAAPCLHRPELAGAQQVVDELPGDAQQFGGLVGAVGQSFGEGIALEDLAHD